MFKLKILAHLFFLFFFSLPGVPLVLSYSLSKPFRTGLDAVQGVSSIQEVGDRSMF